LARCPHDHACMRGITPERVIGAIEAQLALAEPSAQSLD
jgi:hypothetical protein